MATIKQATLKSVNAAIKAAGMENIELVKGKGYFYFIGENADMCQSGVYVYTLNELTVAEWINEAKTRYDAQ